MCYPSCIEGIKERKMQKEPHSSPQKAISPHFIKINWKVSPLSFSLDKPDLVVGFFPVTANANMQLLAYITVYGNEMVYGILKRYKYEE